MEQGLKNGAGKSVGKLIAVEGNLGLGVVRLKEGLDNPTITLGRWRSLWRSHPGGQKRVITSRPRRCDLI